jgi:hypothetical protein
MYHDARLRECKETYIDILRRRRDAITKTRPEERRTIVGFSFTTMLQYIGRFRSRISQEIIMGQNWSIPNTLLALLHLIFNCFLD